MLFRRNLGVDAQRVDLPVCFSEARGVVVHDYTVGQDGAREDEVNDSVLTVFAGARSASRSRERRARPVAL